MLSASPFYATTGRESFSHPLPELLNFRILSTIDGLRLDTVSGHSGSATDARNWPEVPRVPDKRRATGMWRTRMKKIYVGNLPFSATEAQVRELFAKHGNVQSVALITDRETGRPRGFGFVEIEDSGLAPALKALNGYEMDGRALKVNEAQDKPRGGGGGGGSRW
jgi:hypothetical protein